MSIDRDDIQTVALLVDETRCAEILESMLDRNSKPAGRTPTIDSERFLFLFWLSGRVYRSFCVTSMIKVLKALPADVCVERAISRRWKAPVLYGYTRRLHAAVDYTLLRAPDLTEAERTWRRDRLDDFGAELLGYTMYRDPDDPAVFAIDATAVPSPELIRRRPKGTPVTPERQTDDAGPDVVVLPPENEDDLMRYLNPDSIITRKGTKGPSDGSWSGKTSTTDTSKTDWFFGYYAHVVSTTPVTRFGPDRVQVPFFTLSTAKGDVVEPSLRAIDRIQRQHSIEYLAADRLYSNLQYDRWWKKLDERGISQVLDLRADQQGFTDYDGHPIAAAWPHCPATPRELGTIPSLPPQPTESQREEYSARIRERASYAGKPNGRFKDGKGRWGCPARAGQVGCPIQGPESIQIAREQGLPIVHNPPAKELQPAMCRNSSVQFAARTPAQKSLFKTSQRYYWGSEEWQNLYRLRGAIERYFGHAKKHQGLQREAHAYRGLGMATLVTASIFANANIRKLRKWAQGEQTPPDHPLLFTLAADEDEVTETPFAA